MLTMFVTFATAFMKTFSTTNMDHWTYRRQKFMWSS